MGRRILPSHARWLEHEPIVYTSGYLYFRVEYFNGRPTQYLKLRGSRRMVNYWYNLIFDRLNASTVLLLNY